MCGISVLLRLCENLLREDNWSSEDDVPHLVSGTLLVSSFLGSRTSRKTVCFGDSVVAMMT